MSGERYEARVVGIFDRTVEVELSNPPEEHLRRVPVARYGAAALLKVGDSGVAYYMSAKSWGAWFFEPSNKETERVS